MRHLTWWWHRLLRDEWCARCWKYGVITWANQEFDSWHCQRSFGSCWHGYGVVNPDKKVYLAAKRNSIPVGSKYGDYNVSEYIINKAKQCLTEEQAEELVEKLQAVLPKAATSGEDSLVTELLAALQGLLALRATTPAIWEDAYYAMFGRSGKAYWQAAEDAVARAEGAAKEKL